MLKAGRREGGYPLSLYVCNAVLQFGSQYLKHVQCLVYYKFPYTAFGIGSLHVSKINVRVHF
jgi:hypothetical protein